MSHILKYPTKSNKGIILLTHKEVNYFSASLKKIRYEKINRIHRKLIPFTKTKQYFKKKIDELRKHFFIGMHFGWYHRDYPTVPYVDFYLATKSTISFQNESEIYRIPLSSSSFINEAYTNKNYDLKPWDIVCVSHNGKNKRLRSFIESIRKLYDAGKKYKVLLVNKEGLIETQKKNYIQIDEDYHRMFSKDEKNLFTLLRLSPKLDLLGLPPATISEFYNLSKVFALFSEQEGEPRAVSEALICGLPIVINKNIKAGGVGLDFLDDKNSVKFSSYENAHMSLIEAVENYQKFDIESEKLAKVLREDFTIEALKEHLKPLYGQINQKFDGHLDNAEFMANAVNGHIVNVPWGRGRHLSADIFSKPQFDTFYNACMDKVNLKF